MTTCRPFPRGSEWRIWDLHIHTPASFHWDGERFAPEGDPKNTKLVDEMIAALSAASPSVFALMDYWTFDGWFRLKRRLKEAGAPKLEKTVFPGIELRLAAPMTARLNAHVLFSNEVSDQTLKDFLGSLNVEVVNRPLSEEALIALARLASEDKLKHHSYKKSEVHENDAIALRCGSEIAEINCDSYRSAITKVPNGQAIGFMPWDTNDGLAQLKWKDHYAYFLGLFNSSPIFESRDPDLRGAFVNEVTKGNKKYIAAFQDALGNLPRLVVSGSDAHRFKGVPGHQQKRGYGDFPSGKATWIKADPTFSGLIQTIKEPSKRSFVGTLPPKLAAIEANKTFFIERVTVTKIGSADGDWLDGTDIPLNGDLVAVIGNKGSGKSALADAIALLGNSKQKAHFSFLRKDRFRGKTGEPAKSFSGHLIWRDGAAGEQRNLSEDTPDERVELVKYIPQGHFEELCNAHVSGKSKAFEHELRAVIFSHTDDATRLGALDFDQLVDQQEKSFRQRLAESRKDLNSANQEIASVEEQLQPGVLNELQELLGLKLKQLEEHDKVKPQAEPTPGEMLTTEQAQTAHQLDQVSEKLRELDAKEASIKQLETMAAGRAKAAKDVGERLRSLGRTFAQFENDSEEDLRVLGLTSGQLLEFTINAGPLIAITDAAERDRIEQREGKAALAAEKEVLHERRAKLSATLNEPQIKYQQYLRALEAWQNKRSELIGSKSAPETLEGLNARISQISALPDALSTLCERRLKLAEEIFDILEAQRQARAQLFSPLQDLIQNNSLIRDEYKLQFQATLGGTADSLSTILFSVMKQNTGEFRGEDESYATVRRVADTHQFGSKVGVIGFVQELFEKIHGAARAVSKDAVGVSNVLRKDRTAVELYDLLYGLSFLEPRYSLLFQDTQIEQL